MFDINNEGPQHNAGLPPAPDSSDDADNDASQLEEAAAKKQSEKAENVSVSWDPTTVVCKFIKNEIARIAREKMAEGGISSIHSRKKRATDLHGWK
jgi:hypothetical protein